MKIESLIKAIRTIADRDPSRIRTNDRGNRVLRINDPSERYLVDFAPDFTEQGWQQFDTDQDAAYFGVWLNPRLRLTLTYAEGDWTLVECPTRESYLAEVQDAIAFYGEGRIALVIDGDTGEGTTFRQDRAKFLDEPEGADDGFDVEAFSKTVADAPEQIRRSDVFRLLDTCPREHLDRVADWIKAKRPEFASEVDECLADVLAS